MVTDEGTKTAAAGIILASETAEAFAGIERAINEVFNNSREILDGSKRQAITVQQAVASINAINLGSQETAAGVAEVRSATNELVETTAQLQLIDQPPGHTPSRHSKADWLLDESTKSVGRQGIERARAALRSARRRHADLDDGTDPRDGRATAA